MGDILPKKKLFHLVRSSEKDFPPVLILLHGARSNEEWMFEYADLLPAEYLVVAVRAPLQYGLKSFSWFEIDETGLSVTNKWRLQESVDRIVSFIDEVVATYNANPQRVVLMGFSQGGISSYNVAFTHPEKVLGVIILGGRIAKDILPLRVRKERIQAVRFFVAHGTEDERISIDKANEAVCLLQDMGVQVHYMTYSEKHTVNGEMMWDVNQWLEELSPSE